MRKKQKKKKKKEIVYCNQEILLSTMTKKLTFIQRPKFTFGDPRNNEPLKISFCRNFRNSPQKYILF